MKPLVIYHDNCADGFGAAFAAWMKFKDDAEYTACQYGKVTDKNSFVGLFGTLSAEQKVYILDFSFPREVMDAIFASAGQVVWLDHHKTAFETFGTTPNAVGEPYSDELDLGISDQNVTVILDNNRSGAMIAWNYFHPCDPAPPLIAHIDDYDRWQFKIPGTKEFIKALWSYAPWNFEQWLCIFGECGDFTGVDLKAEGAAILRAHDQNVQAVVKSAAKVCSLYIPASNKHKVGLAANCPPHLTSDVGHQLANQSGTYGLLWYISKDGMNAKCSLRSNGDYDVSAIARAFGGGGHKNAAGFEIPLTSLLNWIS